MSIRTKFQPMGYQPSDSSGTISHSKFKQVELIENMQEGSPSLLILDDSNSVWLYGKAFFDTSGNYVFAYNNYISYNTPTRFFKNVKKICKCYGGTKKGYVLFIGTDDKLYYYGEASLLGVDDAYTICSSPVVLMENVKDAWSYSYEFSSSVAQILYKTFFALTTSGKLYACGYNTDKRFGNGLTTDSDSWVEIISDVKYFKILYSDVYGTMHPPVLVVQKTDNSIWFANFTASATVGSFSGSNVYDAFTEISMNQYETTIPTELQFVIEPFTAPYIYIDGTTTPPTNTLVNITSLVFGSQDRIFGDIGFGFSTIFKSETGFTNCVDISALDRNGSGFIYSDGNNIKTYNSTEGSISTLVSNTQIKKLYDFNGRGNAYITKDNKLYMSTYAYPTSFSLIDSNVDYVVKTDTYYAYVTLNDEVHFGSYNPEGNNNTKLDTFLETNTYWQN